MVTQIESPAPLAGGNRAGTDLRGASIGPEHTRSPTHRQARAIAARFAIPAATAALIAELAFTAPSSTGGRLA